MQVDVDRFIEWLRMRGTPEAHLEAYRHYVAELAPYGDITEAVRSEQAAGATTQRITNLRQTAAFITEFAGPSRPIPVVAAAAPAQPAAAEPTGPRKNCQCKRHHDLYLDDDFGTLATLLGGGAGVIGFFLTRIFGLVGAAAIALGLAATGGAATIFSICYRCEGCRRTIRDLDDDERGALRKARAIITLITLAFAGGAAICAVLWYTATKARLDGP